MAGQGGDMRWILGLAVAGCGGRTVCERQVDFYEDCGWPVEGADLGECEALFEQCNGKDHQILGDYMDCMEDAGAITCDPSETDIDQDTIVTCVGKVSGLSEACLTSFVTYGVGGDDDLTVTGSAQQYARPEGPWSSIADG
jgi:hypothetical protein